jgi:hypothetical protein
LTTKVPSFHFQKNKKQEFLSVNLGYQTEENKTTQDV